MKIAWKRPNRRTCLKVVHWTMVPLLIWFVLVQPKDILPFGANAFLFHSNLALIFVVICLGWTADYVVRGLASRPGPKLPKWAQLYHYYSHRIIIWGLCTVAITGFLLGLTSPRLLKAGGFLPIAPPVDMHRANEIVGTFHTLQFYALAGFIVTHALFHIWRHYYLKDNALRIMVPKKVHKWL